MGRLRNHPRRAPDAGDGTYENGAAAYPPAEWPSEEMAKRLPKHAVNHGPYGDDDRSLERKVTNLINHLHCVANETFSPAMLRADYRCGHSS